MTRRPHARLLVAVALGTAILAGCGRPATAEKRPDSEPTPRPSASNQSPPRLSWRPGQRVDARVEIRQSDQATVAGQTMPTALHARAEQWLRVGEVRAGAATVEVRTAGWTWLENESELRPGAPPGPFRIQVDARGVLLTGEYWSLPNHPRPPGIDLFSAGLPDRPVTAGQRWVTRWQRTRRDDLPLDYQVASVASATAAGTLTVDTHLDWDVSQASLTSTGDPERLQGSGHADVGSRFDTARGRLWETSYTSTYDTADAASGTVVRTHGTFAEGLWFTYR